MALAVVQLEGNSTSTDIQDPVTGSFTPTADRLLIAVISTRDDAAQPPKPTASGGSLTWTLITDGSVEADQVYNVVATPRNRITAFWAYSGVAPSSMTVTFVNSWGTMDSACWSVYEIDGSPKDASAFVQVVIDNGDAETSGAITLAAFGNSANRPFGFTAHDKNETKTVSTSFSAIHNLSVSAQNVSLLTEWRDAVDTTLNPTWATSGDWGGFAIEIKESAMPAFVAHGTPVSGVGDVNPTWPSHATDTIGVLFVNSAGNDPVPATPTGFTLIRTEATTGGGTDRARATVFWKRATSGAESAPTIADTGNHQLAYIDTYAGVGTTDPIITAVDGGTKGTNSTTFSVPGTVDTDQPDNLVFAVVSSGDDVTHSGWTNSNLANIQERADESTTAGNDGAIAYATGELDTAGTVGSTTGSISASEENGLITCSLSPTTVVLPIDFEQTVARAYENGHGTDSDVVAGGAAPTLPTDETFLLRFLIERSTSTGTYTGQLEAKLNAEAFFDVTTSSTKARVQNSEAVSATDEDSTTRLSSAKTFTAGKVDKTNGATAATVLTSTQYTELVYVVQIRSADVSDADTVEFRVRNTHADGDADFTEILTATVDIPTRTLPGVVHNKWSGVSVETYGHFGPIMDSNGNLYYVTEGGVILAGRASPDGPEPVLRKSSDGGKLWNHVDQTNSDDQNSSALFDMESLYIARNHLGPDVTGRYYFAVSHGTPGNVDMVPFHTSDHATTPDTWRFADEEELPGVAQAREDWVHLLEKSTGDRVAVYGQTLSSLVRVAYDYEVSGTWQGEQLLDNATASTDYEFAVASLGESDRVLVAWFDGTNNDIHARALDGGTLNDITLDLAGAQTVKNFTTAGPDMVAGPLVGVLQFDSTSDLHLVVWLDNSDTLWSVVMTWNGGTSKYDAGTPAQITTRTVESDYPTIADITGVNASMTVDYATGDVYCMFIDATNRDVYRAKWTVGGGWETEVRVFTSTGDTDRAAYVMCNVFTHSAGNGSAKVLGWVWTVFDRAGGTADGGSSVDGQARYDEFEIPAAVAAPIVRRRQLTTVRM